MKRPGVVSALEHTQLSQKGKLGEAARIHLSDDDTSGSGSRFSQLDVRELNCNVYVIKFPIDTKTCTRALISLLET